MGAKQAFLILAIFAGFEASAGDDRLWPDDCGRITEAVDTQKVVPMLDEIARRVKVSTPRLTRVMPPKALDSLQGHFAKQINQNSPLLQVDQNGLAYELHNLLLGKEISNLDWRLVSEAKIDVDSFDRFISGIGLVEQKDKGIFQVACVNIGRARIHSFLAELRCQDRWSKYREKMFLKRHFDFEKEMAQEEQFYKLLKNPKLETYACFLSQSQS